MVQSETYEPVLLARRAKRLHKTMGGPRPSQHDSPADSKRAILGRTIARPIKLLITSPIVLITSIYVGLVYGYTYLLFTSFPILFQDIYGFSQSQVGLTYLGFGIGSIIGLAVFGAISDRSAAARSLAGGEWKPEYRLPPLLPASLIIPTGLFWYGWSAQTRVHWIVPVLGSGWVGLGTVAVLLPVQTYLIDAFELYAASASAANTVLRSLIGAFLPLAGPSLYSALGQGWGNSVLGFIALAFTPMVWIILKYGERIRKAYPVNV